MLVFFFYRNNNKKLIFSLSQLNTMFYFSILIVRNLDPEKRRKTTNKRERLDRFENFKKSKKGYKLELYK